MRDAERRLPRLSLSALAGFILLTFAVVPGWTQSLDDSWNSAMSSLEASGFVTLAEAFHRLGSFEVAFPTSVAITVVLLLMRRWDMTLAWVAMVGIAEVLSVTTKAIVGRERPLDALVVESSAAYPSGHAMVSGVAIGLGLAMIAGILWPGVRRPLFLAAIAYSVLMAWSRTYLRVHWLTDVVGGLLFGTAVVFAVVWLVSRSQENAGVVSAGEP